MVYAGMVPPKEPPCGECRVELAEENEDAAACFMLTRNQYVTAGQGQVVGISIPAVKIVMDLHGVKDQKGCLMKVINLFHHLQREQCE